MVKFTLRALLGVPAWLLYIAIQVPLIAIGFPLVAILALWLQLRFKYTSHSRTNALHFPAPFGLRLFYLWDNDEDGVDGDPWSTAGDEPKNPAWFEATSTWSVWRRIFVWSAWRNSVGNARRLPFLGMDLPDPKNVVIYLPSTSLLDERKVAATPAVWNEYRKLGPYLARYGYRFELRVPYPGRTHFLWVGWRLAQQDAPNTDIGFALQFFAKF